MVQCPNPKLRDSWALWCLAQDAWLKAQEWITGVSSWVSGKNVTCHFFHGNISLWRGQAPHEAGSPRGSWAKKLLDVGEHLVFFHNVLLDGSEIRQIWGKYNHNLQGFIHPNGGCLGFKPSTVCSSAKWIHEFLMFQTRTKSLHQEWFVLRQIPTLG